MLQSCVLRRHPIVPTRFFRVVSSAIEQPKNPKNPQDTVTGNSTQTAVNAPSPYGFTDLSTTRIRDRSFRKKWVDSLRIYCRGGHGGNGLPKYGGVGGKGGDCIVEAIDDQKLLPNLYSLFQKTFEGDSSKQRVTAERGQNASRACVLGPFGKDSVLQVPVGVTVSNDMGRVIYDLDKAGARVKVAAGGQGGGPANQWLGLKGQGHHIRLDLKLIADVGLVGFPNAGKSTFLKAISRARPKIAAYPFTTIMPNLGHLEYSDERRITMADLPGLIEGAHYNVGMGHKFLKHVERTRLMLFVIDIQGFQLNPTSQYRSAFETVALLNRELELYRSELVDKPCLCLVNKMDTDGAKEKLEKLEEELLRSYEESVLRLDEEMRPQRPIKFDEIIPMSAKFSKTTVMHVKERLRLWIDEHDDAKRGHPNIGSELATLSQPQGPNVI